MIFLGSLKCLPNNKGDVFYYGQIFYVRTIKSLIGVIGLLKFGKVVKHVTNNCLLPPRLILFEKFHTQYNGYY